MGYIYNISIGILNMNCSIRLKKGKCVQHIAFNIIKLINLAFLCSFYTFRLLSKKMGRLDGKVIVLSAAAQGIGKASAIVTIYFTSVTSCLQLYKFSALCCGLLTALCATLMHIINGFTLRVYNCHVFSFSVKACHAKAVSMVFCGCQV